MLFIFLLSTFSLVLATTTDNTETTVPSSSSSPILNSTLSSVKGGGSGCPSNLLAQHNAHRAKHGAPPFSALDPAISAVAQAWAEKQAANGSHNHSNNPKYGENLWAEKGGTLDPAVDSWYAEVAHYHSYGAEPDMSQIGQWGHFTALVWKGTAKFGCGCADYKKGADMDKIIFCNYEPPGNVRGHFKENVFPPK